jgi:hypothetical protein
MRRDLAVLFIAANPSDTTRLRIDREQRVIREAIQLGRQRERIRFEVRVAATAHDLRRAMIDQRYDMVHVSAHAADGVLLLEDDGGQPVPISTTALANFFAAHGPPRGSLTCVLINACNSHSMAAAMCVRIPITITMRGPLADTAAIEFARGYYDGLAAGLEFAQAFEQGRACVKLAESTHDGFDPVLTSEQRDAPIPTGSWLPTTAGPICPICGAEDLPSSTVTRCENCGDGREDFPASAYGRTQLHIRFDPRSYAVTDAASLIEAVSVHSLLGFTGFVEHGEIQFRTRTLKCRSPRTADELRRAIEPIVGVKVSWSYGNDPHIAFCDINWFTGEAHFHAIADEVGLFSEYFSAIERHVPSDSFSTHPTSS